eukprot:534731-Amphidinium_carterae.1
MGKAILRDCSCLGPFVIPRPSFFDLYPWAEDRLESLVVQNNDLREKLALADSVLYRLLEPSAEPSTRSFSRKGLWADQGQDGKHAKDVKLSS